MANGRLGMAAAGAGAVLVLVSACGGSGGGGGTARGELAAESSNPVTVTPANGATAVKPDGTVEVKTSAGTLDAVTLQGGGKAVEGQVSADRKSWRSSRTLIPGTDYTVTAQGKRNGKPVTFTSRFSTLKPSKTLKVVDITPNRSGEKVGVGMPIFVRFNRAVTGKAAKAAVERTLTVTPEKPVEGAWRWIGDSQAVYRTRTYWAPHQTVKIDARLAGVDAGNGVYGAKDSAATMQVGAEQITKGDISEHEMTVYRDGRKVRRIPFSAGNGTTREYTTTSGAHLLMERESHVTMVSPGRKPGDPGYYKTDVDWAVRFSNSGEYTHSAPWNVGIQGSANTSHGCLNLSPANARWYYDHAQRGDVLNLTGSTRKVEWDNGWSFWQMPFDTWKQGSALA
ncbi:L,D-transpeptidase [Actinomadura rupiterrae]|uniref:L,D-transpeptidase n=1 Tax=Actinomadura rupiterrae TaxID=559627 RepID=UPI0020A3E51D|nr:Ig-like domain-containing protein [Actinomadura rupiterrae]MCP2340780.1 lipoprotein-anchoring transpeptidase ErfK/SrfK [Actinomadura rupiterrae]